MFRPSGSSTRARTLRRLELRDEHAVEFVEQLGWRPLSDLEGFTLAGDLLHDGDFVASRFWGTPGRWERRVEEPVIPRTAVLICVEGNPNLTFRGDAEQTVRLMPGQTFIFDPSTLTAASCTVSTAFLLIGHTFLPPASDALRSPQVSGQYDQILISATNALLNSTVQAGSAGFSRVRRALESLAHAVAMHNGIDSAVLPRGERTYRQATALIDDSYEDPNTSVDSIAKRLNISRSQLFRVFQKMDDTPSAYLRRIRVDMALRSLREGATAAEAARRSGFDSTRRMYRALDRPHR